MIDENTVLVLGAGASVRYGFPTAYGIVEQINHDVMEIGEEGKLAEIFLDSGIVNDFGILKSFVGSLVGSGARSIDAYLEHRKVSHIEELGKAIIAAVLIYCEKESAVLRDLRNPRWYEFILRKMNAPIDCFGENKLAIVTFNYDRSFEYFLWYALQEKYSISGEQAAQLISMIEIIHVHGQLCKPHFTCLVDKSIKAEMCRPYIPDVSAEAIIQSAKQIKIVYETSGNVELFKRANQVIREAKTLCFLGFGYHLNNLKRLGIDKETLSSIKDRGGRVCGTSSGLTESDIQATRRVFDHKLKIELHDEDISDFLERRDVIRIG